MAARPDSPEKQAGHLADAPFAYENADFLNSSDGRILRILAEYQEPMARFRRQRIEDTVVFFGSARVRALDATTRDLESLEQTVPPETMPPHGQSPMSAVPGSSDASRPEHTRAETAVAMAGYYEDARALAGMLSRWSKSLPGKRHRFVVTSGGGPGIMEAANRGAFEAGSKSIGLNIHLPFEQAPNPYITPELNFTFHYFFMRKFWFAYLAKALVVFPGGFGTMDEMFELLTLAQTHKLAEPITIVIYGSAYWKRVINFDAMVERGVIALEDLNLFHFADTPEAAFEILKSHLTEHHLDSPAGSVDLLEDELTIEAACTEVSVPASPAPNAQEMLGPDIARTRR